MEKKIKLVSVKPAEDGKHKFVATFDVDGKSRNVKFGVKGSFSYVDGADIYIRDAYRARHKSEGVNPNPMAKGPLSYWITWGNSKHLVDNVMAYKRRYGV